ncbi:UNVERIFIED_CONTAM: hypothetical protein FKN15_025298 [Acipenser sinensis]
MCFQGLGLYAARDIEKHTMVIEYMGTVIRNEVANRKEKHYESQNRGVFMFRMDSEHVIDATLTGGPARWVCSPAGFVSCFVFNEFSCVNALLITEQDTFISCFTHFEWD